MTVAELITQLQKKHPDAEVWIAHPGEASRPVTAVDLADHGPTFAFVYAR